MLLPRVTGVFSSVKGCNYGIMLIDERVLSWLRVRMLQATTYPFEITYGTGAVAGSVGFETMTLGSGKNTLKVPHQGFGMVYDSSMDFLTASCDGLFVSPPTPCNC